MSGQDGSARALLSYDTESDTVLGGFNFKPAPRWKFGAEIAWNDSSAGIAPYRFEVPQEFLNANQSYDFSLSHLYSDLDLSRIEAELNAQYSFAEDRWIGLEYRRVDVEDDAPYITDLTGAIDWYALSVGWRVK